MWYKHLDLSLEGTKFGLIIISVIEIYLTEFLIYLSFTGLTLLS